MKDVFLRRADRGAYIIPMLLHDTRSHVVIKAVILDISSRGVRCFTNDRRLLLMSEEILREKSFRLEFDFVGVDTIGLEGKVVHIRPGKNPRYERQLGIGFTQISPVMARDINRTISADEAARASKATR